jgi:hypothetical protein
MRILQATMILGLLSAPAMAEEENHVIGAKRPTHHAAPKAGDGQGDYGFTIKPAHALAGESKQSRDTTRTGLHSSLAADPDLQAYEEEEALVEAEAAYTQDDATGSEIVLD